MLCQTILFLLLLIHPTLSLDAAIYDVFADDAEATMELEPITELRLQQALESSLAARHQLERTVEKLHHRIAELEAIVNYSLVQPTDETSTHVSDPLDPPPPPLDPPPIPAIVSYSSTHAADPLDPPPLNPPPISTPKDTPPHADPPPTLPTWPRFHPSSAKRSGIDVNRCDVLRVPNTPSNTPIDWDMPFVSFRPSWPADTTWSNPDAFLNLYGAKKIMVDSPGFLAYQGYSIAKNTIEQYMHNNAQIFNETQQSQTHTLLHGNTTFSKYGFNSFHPNEWPEMMKETTSTPSEENYHRSQFNAHTEQLHRHNVEQIAIGQTGSGLHWHRHDAAWNSIVVGQKVWFLSSPDQDPPLGLEGNHTTLTWWREVGQRTTKRRNKEKDAVLMCVLGPQETMHVPNKWWHATINLGAVVSRSVRRSSKQWGPDHPTISLIVTEIQSIYVKKETDLLSKQLHNIQNNMDFHLLVHAIQKVFARYQMLVIPDSLVALCINDQAFQGYVTVVKRFKDIYEEIMAVFVSMKAVRQKKRKKKRRKKKKVVNTVMELLEDYAYKNEFFEKHMICAKPFERSIVQKYADSHYIELTVLQAEKQLYKELCGEDYDTKCEGFRRRVAETPFNEDGSKSLKLGTTTKRATRVNRKKATRARKNAREESEEDIRYTEI